MFSFLRRLFPTMKGFSSGYKAQYIYNQAEMLQRGASPNTFQLRVMQISNLIIASQDCKKLLNALKWTRMHWLITPFMFFLPFVINSFPRAGANNVLFFKTRDFFHDISIDLFERTWILKILGLFAYTLYRILNGVPVIQNRYIIRVLFLLDRHLVKISLFFTMGVYGFLFFVGHAVMATAACITVGLAFLSDKNLIPTFARNLFKKWGHHLCFFYMLLAGEPLDRFLCIVTLPFYADYVLKKPLAWLLDKLGKTEIAEALREQDCVMPSFDFKCTASQFIEKIKEMEKKPCEVVRAHVLDNTNLLPSLLPSVELQDLFDMFQEINWVTHQSSIEAKWGQDWQRRLADNESTFEQKIVFLKENLQTLINNIKNKNISSLMPGAEELLERYLQNITAILKKILSADDALKVDSLISLALEGDYCSQGILQIAEECYRNLIGKKEALSLKDCVRLIHQRNRQNYFDSEYVKNNLHRDSVDIFYSKLLGVNQDFVNEKNDIHAYAAAVYYFAPRLGLPAEFARHDETLALIPPFVKDLTSAWMGLEHQFWKETTVEKLKKEINEEVNYPLLPIALVDKWYEAFIDTHVEGTEEEKDKIKNQCLPYHTEYHRQVPLYRLKPEILHLILLDFGVISLSKNQENVPSALSWLYRAKPQTTLASNEQQNDSTHHQRLNVRKVK